MRTLSCALYLVAMAAVILVGCSGGDEHSPTGVFTPASDQLPLSSKVIGPSDIVLCLDVSDNVSQDELQSVIAALETNLADPALIPQDGSITVTALVYGDTSAAVLDAPVPVTPTSLEDTIFPALRGLEDDRLVPTTEADLAAALDQALPFVDPGSVLDRHVLVLGSGTVADAAATEASCAALGDAGAMVSAVALGSDETAAVAFQACADSTGGFFGMGGDDFTGACAAALTFMLQADLSLVPETADRMRGEDHEVTATMFRGADPDAYPLAGLDVDFIVVNGPNAGDMATAVTDTDGVALFSFTGDGGPGVDTIVAEGLHPGTGLTLSDTVTVTWDNAAPDCDAGGPYLVTVDTDTMQVTLDGSLSGDADGDTLSFYWMVDCDDATLDDPTAVMPVLELTGACLCVDSLMVDLMVTDGIDTSYCESVVLLDDQRPPVIEVREEPLLLWPPNHRYHEITPEMMITTAEDACGQPIDLSAVTVVEVRSDEPEDAQGNGDGRTTDDMVVECPNTVSLRAERAGSGNGRVYTIVYRIVSDTGEATDVEARVVVPHDASDDDAVEDNGAGYMVDPGCN